MRYQLLIYRDTFSFYRGLENQSYRASGLTLLTAAITLWNTVYIERAIESLKRKGIPINEQDVIPTQIDMFPAQGRKMRYQLLIYRDTFSF